MRPYPQLKGPQKTVDVEPKTMSPEFFQNWSVCVKKPLKTIPQGIFIKGGGFLKPPTPSNF